VVVSVDTDLGCDVPGATGGDAGHPPAALPDALQKIQARLRAAPQGECDQQQNRQGRDTHGDGGCWPACDGIAFVPHQSTPKLRAAAEHSNDAGGAGRDRLRG